MGPDAVQTHRTMSGVRYSLSKRQLPASAEQKETHVFPKPVLFPSLHPETGQGLKNTPPLLIGTTNA